MVLKFWNFVEIAQRQNWHNCENSRSLAKVELKLAQRLFQHGPGIDSSLKKFICLATLELKLGQSWLLHGPIDWTLQEHVLQTLLRHNYLICGPWGPETPSVSHNAHEIQLFIFLCSPWGHECIHNLIISSPVSLQGLIFSAPLTIVYKTIFIRICKIPWKPPPTLSKGPLSLAPPISSLPRKTKVKQILR